MKAAVVILTLAISFGLFASPPLTTFASTSPGLACGSFVTTSTTLKSDVGPCSNNGLVVSGDNIILDCNGHSITGTSGSNDGILLVGFGDTIKNCVVSGFRGAAFALSASSNLLVNNDAENNDGSGFSLSSSNFNQLKNNAAVNNGVGFLFTSSDKNNLTNNVAKQNLDGGYAVTYYSSFNIFDNNRAQDNTGSSGFVVRYYSVDNSFNNNKADGNAGNGYVVEEFSSFNTFTANKAVNNGLYGYLDSTVPVGNIYTHNQCAANDLGGSNPAGLCD